MEHKKSQLVCDPTKSPKHHNLNLLWYIEQVVFVEVLRDIPMCQFTSHQKPILVEILVGSQEALNSSTSSGMIELGFMRCLVKSQIFPFLWTDLSLMTVLWLE